MERDTINRLGAALNEIRNVFDVSIFVVIKRSEATLWDIVIGGKNLDTQENLIQIADVLKKNMQPNEMRIFSRTVLLNSTESFVVNLRQAFSIERGAMELRDTQINNIYIKHAFLLYCK
jgi:hypothetical protein